MLRCFRHYGGTVCGGWAARPPVQPRAQFMGQADELAAQHNVSVLWDIWNSAGRQHYIQAGADWC